MSIDLLVFSKKGIKASHDMKLFVAHFHCSRLIGYFTESAINVV